jgi:NAD(P)-dependent dehydrogenase (short-subunit alcohol dehydrogenase family)
MTRRLTGKAAVVTGGGRGIGLHVAAALATQGTRVMIADLGAQLDGTGRDETPGATAAAAIERAGGECSFMVVDVADPVSAQDLIDATVDRLGFIDILVNAAGNLRAGAC